MGRRTKKKSGRAPKKKEAVVRGWTHCGPRPVPDNGWFIFAERDVDSGVTVPVTLRFELPGKEDPNG